MVLVMQNCHIFSWLGYRDSSEYLQVNKFLTRIQVLQEMTSPVQMRTFEWQAAEPFLVAGSQTVKSAVCEHTSTLWLTSDALTLSTAMSVQECAPSSSLESYTGCSRLPLLCRYRSTHLATQFTPANFRACNFTGQQIQLTEKGTS